MKEKRYRLQVILFLLFGRLIQNPCELFNEQVRGKMETVDGYKLPLISEKARVYSLDNILLLRSRLSVYEDGRWLLSDDVVDSSDQLFHASARTAK